MKIIVGFLFLIIIVYLIYYYINLNFEFFKKNIKLEKPEESKLVYKINTCKYKTPDNIKKVFADNNIKEIDNNLKTSNNVCVYLPCTYDNIENEIENMNLQLNENNKIFIIHNADEIVAKEALWKNLVSYYGLEKALTMIPMTYVLYDKNDVKRLIEDFDKEKLYILKKNVQRQEGIKIINNLDEILKNKDGHILVQELLQDPYLIKGRKINLRVYVLVVCKGKNFEVYAYKDGFMYYTKDFFKENSVESGPNITTGYVDRWIYDVHPLTHEDFRKYLDSDRSITETELRIFNNGNKLSNYVFTNIYDLIKNMFTAFYGKIGNGKKLHDHTSFQLFGLDVAIDNKLQAKIMEVNKGPDLGSKDDRDGNLKRGLIKDILRTVDLVDNDSTNKFLKVLEIK